VPKILVDDARKKFGLDGRRMSKSAVLRAFHRGEKRKLLKYAHSGETFTWEELRRRRRAYAATWEEEQKKEEKELEELERSLSGIEEPG
jgi:hypothetical protein